MRIAAVFADANVLLSAVVGKAALRVMTEWSVEVHVARFNADEVEEYLVTMAEKYALPPELVALQWRLLPIRGHSQSAYRRLVTGARRDLADRDPNDANTLALARTLRLPLWTSDRDLGGQGIDCFSTARLLKALAVR